MFQESVSSQVVHSQKPAMKVDSAVLCLMFFFLLLCFVVCFSQYEYKFIQEKTHQDWGISWLHQASAQMTLPLHQPEARGMLSENICMQHTLGLPGPGWASQACQMTPELLFGCLVLSAGQDSIFDWLSSVNSKVGVDTGYILTCAKMNNGSGVCCVFFFGAVYLYLPGKGLAAKHLSFIRSARMFETFGSIVPNTVTRDQF